MTIAPTIFAVLLPRAEEAWEPVLLGGLIPILGALAIAYIIYRAVRDNDEDGREPCGRRLSAAGSRTLRGGYRRVEVHGAERCRKARHRRLRHGATLAAT